MVVSNPKNLAEVMGNRQLQSGLAQKDIASQQALGAAARAPGREAVPTAISPIQEAATGRAVATGAITQEAVKTSAQEALQQKQEAVQAAKIERARALALKKQQLSQMNREQEVRFAGLQGGLKAKLFDSQMQFKRDELQRVQLNERQLADWALTTARNDVELQEFEDAMTRSVERKRMMLEFAAAKVEQALKQAWEGREQEMDQQTKEEIIQIKAAADEARRRAKERAAIEGSMWTAGGTIVGTILGGAIGAIATRTPMGAAAGASIGAGLGSAGGQWIASNPDRGSAATGLLTTGLPINIDNPLK